MNTTEMTLPEWLLASRPMTCQQVPVLGGINQIIHDLEQSLTLPNLVDGDRNLIQNAIPKWKAVRQQVVGLFGSDISPAAHFEDDEDDEASASWEENLAQEHYRR